MSDDKPPQGRLDPPAGASWTARNPLAAFRAAEPDRCRAPARLADDIRTGELGDVELDMTALTAMDSTGALALTRACAALWRRARPSALMGAEPPTPTVKVPDGGGP